MVLLQFDKNGQFKITIPKSLALAKGWKKGDKLSFHIDNQGKLVVEKQK